MTMPQALAVNPDVLLMDKPFDAQNRAAMQDEIGRPLAESDARKTTILVTHSIDEAILLRQGHRNDAQAGAHQGRS